MLIDQVVDLFPWAGKSIKGLILLADGEFIGNQLLEYLFSKEISFVISLRSNMSGCKLNRVFFIRFDNLKLVFRRL